MRVLVVLALVAACGGDDGGGGPTGPLGFDVAAYDYTMELPSRYTTATTTLHVTRGGDCATIEYALAGADDVLFGGETPASWSVESGVLNVCGSGWATGEDVELTALFTHPVEVWDLPTTTGPDSQVGLTATAQLVYLLSWVGECDRHGPCDARPDRFAAYRFHVAHEPGWQVLCPGTLSSDGDVTTCDFAYPGGPSYSTFAFIASPNWTMTSLGSHAGVAVSLYDTPASGIAAKLDADGVGGFLAWMVDTFGAFPYGGELRYVVAPTYWAGFEHPGNIVLDEGLGAGDADSLRHTALHELAHQWAGDQTTLKDLYDFVWKESMVEYLSFVYEDESLDPAVAKATRDYWKYAAPGSVYFLVPDERPQLLEYYGDVYAPGPMILFRQIEAMFGRPAVIGALQMLLGQAHAVGVADVQAALEASTGQDLGAYFDAWVYGSAAPQWPKATVTRTDAGGGMVDVGVTLATLDGVARGCKFDVRLKGAQASDVLDVPFDFGPSGTAVAPQRVTPGFTVTGYELDPDGECLVYDAAPTKPSGVAPSRRVVHGWRTGPALSGPLGH